MAQVASPFRLVVPDLGNEALDLDELELPGRLPKRLEVQVLNPVAVDVDYGKIYTKLNGESAGFITTVAHATQGKIAKMDFSLREGMKLNYGINTIEVLAVTKRGRKYYRNFILKTKDATRNAYFAYQTKLSPKDEDGIPPDVLLLEPEFPVRIEDGEARRTVRVKGTVSAVGGLSRIIVGGKDIPPAATFDTAVEVDGTSNLTVEVLDANNSKATVVVPVTKAQARQTNFGGGRRYGLVIGISEHASKPELPRLPRASQDARDFAHMLETSLGFAPEDILLLTDQEATMERVRSGFRAIGVRPKAGDLFVLYFAGYGLHDPVNPEKLYLAMHGSQYTLMEDTALGLEELENLLAGIRGGHSLLIFEAARTLPEPWASPHTNLINDYLFRRFSKAPDRTVLVASGLNQVADVSGLFTRLLIEAASGKGDWNHDGIVTTKEFVQYVAFAVRKESQDKQIPLLASGEESSVALAAIR
jgi:hypothetical protein